MNGPLYKIMGLNFFQNLVNALWMWCIRRGTPCDASRKSGIFQTDFCIFWILSKMCHWLVVRVHRRFELIIFWIRSMTLKIKNLQIFIGIFWWSILQTVKSHGKFLVVKSVLYCEYTYWNSNPELTICIMNARESCRLTKIIK